MAKRNRPEEPEPEVMSQDEEVAEGDDVDELLLVVTETGRELRQREKMGPDQLRWWLENRLWPILATIADRVTSTEIRLADLEEEDAAEGITEDTAAIIHSWVGEAVEVMVELEDIVSKRHPEVAARISELVERAAPLIQLVEDLIMVEEEEGEDEEWDGDDADVFVPNEILAAEPPADSSPPAPEVLSAEDEQPASGEDVEAAADEEASDV